MHKRLFRLFHFLLIPCLLTEPLHAIGMASFPSSRAQPLANFAEQALMNRLVVFFWSQGLNRRPSIALAEATSSPIVFYRLAEPNEHPSGPVDPELAEDYLRLTDRYNDMLRKSRLALKDLLETADAALRAQAVSPLLAEFAAIERVATMIVTLIEENDAASLGASSRQERYFRNVVGVEPDAPTRHLIDVDRSWVVDNFELRTPADRHPTSSVVVMKLSSYAEWLCSIVESMFELGRPRLGILDLLDRHRTIFSESLSFHLNHVIASRDHSIEFISVAASPAETAALAVHEIVHRLLIRLHPSYRFSNVATGVGPSDWFTTAFEMVSLERHDVFAQSPKLDQIGVDRENQQLFKILLTQMNSGNGMEWTQVTQWINASLPAATSEKYLFYRQGAALGAHALRTAMRMADAQGRGTDEALIYSLAARYIFSAAEGGPASFAAIMERADRRAAERFKKDEPPLEELPAVAAPAALPPVAEAAIPIEPIQDIAVPPAESESPAPSKPPLARLRPSRQDVPVVKIEKPIPVARPPRPPLKTFWLADVVHNLSWPQRQQWDKLKIKLDREFSRREKWQLPLWATLHESYAREIEELFEDHSISLSSQSPFRHISTHPQIHEAYTVLYSALFTSPDDMRQALQDLSLSHRLAESPDGERPTLSHLSGYWEAALPLEEKIAWTFFALQRNVGLEDLEFLDFWLAIVRLSLRDRTQILIDLELKTNEYRRGIQHFLMRHFRYAQYLLLPTTEQTPEIRLTNPTAIPFMQVYETRHASKAEPVLMTQVPLLKIIDFRESGGATKWHENAEIMVPAKHYKQIFHRPTLIHLDEAA